MGCMHLYLPSRGVHTTIDFHGRAPAATRADMWADRIVREAEDGWGFILRDRENEIGYQSITTPRTLAALDHALRRYGTMTLADAYPAGDRLCRTGLPDPAPCRRVLAPPTHRRPRRQYRHRHQIPGRPEDLHRCGRHAARGRRDAAQPRPGEHLSPHRPPRRRGFLQRRNRRAGSSPTCAPMAA